MPWFIKTESFTSKTMSLSPEMRQEYIDRHRSWVINLHKSGIQVVSGYLVNKQGLPGGGGLLIIQANTFNEAESLIRCDPMIIANLVKWELHEWKKVYGQSYL